MNGTANARARAKNLITQQGRAFEKIAGEPVIVQFTPQIEPPLDAFPDPEFQVFQSPVTTPRPQYALMRGDKPNSIIWVPFEEKEGTLGALPVDPFEMGVSIYGHFQGRKARRAQKEALKKQMKKEVKMTRRNAKRIAQEIQQLEATAIKESPVAAIRPKVVLEKVVKSPVAIGGGAFLLYKLLTGGI